MSEKLYKQSKVELIGCYIDLSIMSLISVDSVCLKYVNKYTDKLIVQNYDKTFTKERALEILEIWRCL